VPPKTSISLPVQIEVNAARTPGPPVAGTGDQLEKHFVPPDNLLDMTRNFSSFVAFQMRSESTSADLRRSALLALFLMTCVLTPIHSFAAGVTIITHGYDGNVNGWVTGMANQMTNYGTFPGTNSTTYTITLTTDGSSIYYQWSRTGIVPTNTVSGEIIVKLDWSQMSGGTYLQCGGGGDLGPFADKQHFRFERPRFGRVSNSHDWP